MDKDLLKKVRRIEIKTKGLSRELFSGQYHTAFKGKGMAFSEVREYHYGDDIRNIDWNVTARLNHPYIKVFEEEREMTVMLLVDVSGSNLFGTKNQFKQDMIAEVAATLAFSAIQNNDKVGVIFFSDRIEKFIPPKKGTTHILHIIRELIYFKPQSTKTDITEALRYLTNIVKKRCTVFLFSDFYNKGFEDAIKIASRKHDLVALQVSDEKEKALPQFGIVQIFDPESQQKIWIDTSSNATRKEYEKAYHEQHSYLQTLFKKNEIDHVLLDTGRDYIKPLLILFRKRGGKY